MRLENLAFACCLLIPGSTLAAQQSGGAPADLISGTWTGTMGPDEATQRPITMKLAFSGKGLSGIITGPPRPGDIKTGTFDPQTGALTLGVVVRGDGMNVTFEGKLAQGTVTGRVIFPDQSGTFRIRKDAAGPAASAPDLRADETAAELRRAFGEVSAYITKAAALVPADKYSYRPTASVRTFGEVVGHIADSYAYYCARAAGRDTQWSDAIEKGNTSKAVLAAKLKQSLDGCTAVYAGSGKAGALIDNVGHTNLHYGNIVTYLRMMGLVPPSN